VLRPFSVDTGATTAAQRLTTNAAGPLFSLVSGVLILLIPRSGPLFGRLFVLWSGLLAVQEFNGYLITGPFVPAGDVGVVLAESGAPEWAGYLGLLVGVSGTVLAGRVATARLLELVEPEREIGGQLHRLGLFAWLLGAVVAVLLSLGSFEANGTGVFEVAGVLTVGLLLFLVRVFVARLAPPEPGRRVLWVVWPWRGSRCSWCSRCCVRSCSGRGSRSETVPDREGCARTATGGAVVLRSSPHRPHRWPDE
jgi:hypothetical protein